MTNFSDDLIDANLKMLRSASFTDCIINSGTFSFPAHKAILGARNSYFAAAFGGCFKESTTNTVHLEDELPFAVECLLVYLYTLQYPEVEMLHEVKDAPKSQWKYHFEIFRIADSRNARELRLLAAFKLVRTMNKTWDQEALIDIVPVLWEIEGREAKVIRYSALVSALLHCATLKRSPKFDQLLRRETNVGFVRDYAHMLMGYVGFGFEETDIVTLGADSLNEHVATFFSDEPESVRLWRDIYLK